MNSKYYLKNENGQTLEINDFKNSVFNLSSDLGISKKLAYSRVGNVFILNSEEPEQLKIEGAIKFLKSEQENEENYKKYEKFLKVSSKLTFINIRNEKGGFVEYYIDVKCSNFGRVYKNGHILNSKLTLHCTTSWYKQNNIVYTIEEETGKFFGFPIDFQKMRFSSGNKSKKIITNDGYSEAPIHISLKGPILNPEIQVLKNNKIINSIKLDIELSRFEELEYCTRDDYLLLRKINADGTYTNLFDEIDQNNENNFFKIPCGVSILQIKAESDIKYAKITIYPQY